MLGGTSVGQTQRRRAGAGLSLNRLGRERLPLRLPISGRRLMLGTPGWEHWSAGVPR
jgi:hypothetical protein